MGRLDLFPSLRAQILIPPAVYAEVTSGGTGASDLAQATWLTIRSPIDAEAVTRLRHVARLDPGESEAIVLAGELGPDSSWTSTKVVRSPKRAECPSLARSA